MTETFGFVQARARRYALVLANFCVAKVRARVASKSKLCASAKPGPVWL
jgi:hypothetical protein